MSAIRTPVLLLFIFAAAAAISAAQSGSNDREVVQASEILEKIERGEPVNYVNKVIEGNLSIRDPKHLDVSWRNIRSSRIAIRNCLIKDKVDFSNTQFNDSVSFSGSTFYGKSDFKGAQFNKDVSFNDSVFLKDASFRVARFGQDADFIHAQFSDNLNFGEANFNHIADFSAATIRKYANFLGVGFNGTANFQFANFLGRNSFQEAVFNGTADFSRVLFDSSAGFSGAVFNDSANFFYAFFDDSSFTGAQFNKDVDFTLSHFKGYASFSGAQINHSVFFKKAEFRDDAVFDWSFLKSAHFNQTVILGELSLKGTQIDNLNLSDAEIGGIVLRSWKSIGHMEYDEMAYQLLLSNFRNRNLPDEANECYYDYREGRRATLSTLSQPADYALMLFYGYGVKPERPVIWAFVFMAIFAALFWWRQGIIPVQKGEPEEEAARFTLLEAMAFSVMTFLSGGKLVFDPPEYRIAPGKPWRDVQICKALFVWERLMGMMLLFMFAVAVTKTIILGS